MKHLYRCAALFLLLEALASAQMVEFDLPGEFLIECTKGSSCVFDGDSTFSAFDYGPGVETAKGSFSPSTGYYFIEDGGFIAGADCNSGSLCFVTCDEACTCITDPTQVVGEGNSTTVSIGGLGLDSPDVIACPVLATLPDVSIIIPSEYVTYQTVQGAGLISLRCVEEFAFCSIVTSAAYFTVETSPEEGTDFFFARDYEFNYCSADEICYISCDPRCECQINNDDGEPEECDIQFPPSVPPTTSLTASPTLTPISGAACTPWLIPTVLALVFGFVIILM